MLRHDPDMREKPQVTGTFDLVTCGSRFVHTEEVTGSNPVSPTREIRRLEREPSTSRVPLSSFQPSSGSERQQERLEPAPVSLPWTSVQAVGGAAESAVGGFGEPGFDQVEPRAQHDSPIHAVSAYVWSS
jgi:hypothetical protein